MNLADALPALAPGLMAQRDTTGPVPEGQRFPGSTECERIVMMGADVVVTAMASVFPTTTDAAASVDSYARVLFADQGVEMFIPLEGLESLAPDARGACASGFPDGEGAIAMMAWSAQMVRLDLSVSVFADGAAADIIWDRFSRTTFDQMAEEMAKGARKVTAEGDL